MSRTAFKKLVGVPIEKCFVSGHAFRCAARVNPGPALAAAVRTTESQRLKPSIFESKLVASLKRCPDTNRTSQTASRTEICTDLFASRTSGPEHPRSGEQQQSTEQAP